MCILSSMNETCIDQPLNSLNIIRLMCLNISHSWNRIFLSEDRDFVTCLFSIRNQEVPKILWYFTVIYFIHSRKVFVEDKPKIKSIQLSEKQKEINIPRTEWKEKYTYDWNLEVKVMLCLKLKQTWLSLFIFHIYREGNTWIRQ